MSSRRLPLLVAFCVLVVGVLTVLAVAAVPTHRRVPTRTTVPQQFPGPSRLTASLATNPVGRAVALYRQGTGLALAGSTQTLVLGSDGGTVRRLDGGRGGTGAAGADTASLSPDGRTVAVGSHRLSGGADVTLVDLASGQTRSYVVPRVLGVVPVAWSADASRLAYLGTAGPSAHPAGQLFVFDVASHRAVPVPGADVVTSAAFSPDGTRLAIQSPGASAVRVVDPRTGTGTALPVPDGEHLAGGAAWSPDGDLIAVSDGDRRLDFVPTQPGRPAPAPLTSAGDVLGWSSGSTVVHARPAATGAGEFRVERTDVRTGTTTAFWSVPTPAGLDVSGVSLATALLPGATPVPSVPADRGPWPVGLRVVLVVGAALLSVPAVVGLRRRYDEFRRIDAAPEWARDVSRG
ncbi:WD40 repeat domain-containing protein [Kineococcus rhizosphaerae]|uniref:WD40 repeat protein n=1 Tax=Kineococcus rhizosphaerae TaxID=559628 RepID=A0A2T0R2J7_9ACTN|nr:PD40 domain-containing protein [Kineococcus rhizosphaerae]PRY14032.1 WD40 repeat protein [Kineococcus rhizosphaerae]